MLCSTSAPSKHSSNEATLFPLTPPGEHWVQVIFSKKINSMRNGHITGEAHAHPVWGWGVMQGYLSWAGSPEQQGVLPAMEHCANTTTVFPPAWGLPTHHSLLAWAEDVASNHWVFPSIPPADLGTHAPSGISVKASWVSISIWTGALW